MEKIIVKNFGPILDVELQIYKLTMIFGSQATGKSVLAKLLKAVNSSDLVRTKDIRQTLKDYNIDTCLQDDTYIRFESSNRVMEFQNGVYSDTLSKKYHSRYALNRRLFSDKLSKNDGNLSSTTIEILLPFIMNTEKEYDFIKDLADLENTDEDSIYEYISKVLTTSIISVNLPRVIYIPAERMLFAQISDSIFSLSSIANLPKCLLRFGSLIETSRKLHPIQDIPFLKGLTYKFEEKQDLVHYRDSTIPLSYGASGLQTSIPLALVCNNEFKKEGTFFIVEEPEQNLFPTTQYHLVKYLSERCLFKTNRLLVTTHSPYILSAFDNLILAWNAGTISKNQTVLRSIVPKKQWINIDEVGAYFIENGKCKDMIDRKAKRINGSFLDKASELIGREHSRILEQMYINERSNC